VPLYFRTICILDEIRTALLQLCPLQRDAITSTIDMARIRARTDSGHCAWQECVLLAMGIMQLIVQSHAQQMETMSLWRPLSESMPNAPVEEQPALFAIVLQFMLKCVNGMRIDSANRRIDAVRETVVRQGLCYEQSKFQEKLTQGVLTVAHTKVRGLLSPLPISLTPRW
jgi:hypothetical protein